MSFRQQVMGIAGDLENEIKTALTLAAGGGETSSSPSAAAPTGGGVSDVMASLHAPESQASQEATRALLERQTYQTKEATLPEKAYRVAQSRGFEGPSRIVFDESGRALGTSSEIASVLADNALKGENDSRIRTSEMIKRRREFLKSKIAGGDANA